MGASKCLALLCTGSILMSCSTVDHFEPRALQYNQEAANTKSNSIFLNILRSAHRLPLQFTEYTTTVGQSSLSGQVSGSVPVATIPSNLSKTFALNPQVSGLTQNQVTIQNLNSQEFYYGLQTPLKQQMLASFMAIGYDPELVLMLAVSSLKRRSTTTTNNLDNDPSDYRKINNFYDGIKLLLLAGLSFETTRSAPQGVGPELSENEAKALLPHYVTASAAAASNGGSLPEFSRRGDRYQLTENKSSFRICFQKSKLDEFFGKGSSGINVERRGPDYIVHLKLTRTGYEQLFDMTIDPSRLCGASSSPSRRHPDLPPIDWSFEIRSVEAIYNYLGGFVRKQWQDPVLFESVYQFPRNPPSRSELAGPNFFLFRTYNGYLPNTVITADLGSTYSIVASDFGTQDMSTQTISFLTDLWALQSSAKSFPATSTISVTTTQ